MFQLLLLLLALLTPKVELSNLSSPSFKLREQASKQLCQQMTWHTVVRLRFTPLANLETRRRVESALDIYYSQVWENNRPWPYIDALNTKKPCHAPETIFVHDYLRRARLDLYSYQKQFEDYRHATKLMVTDLRRLCLPPILIRDLLLHMEESSVEYDRAAAALLLKYRQMPQPPRH